MQNDADGHDTEVRVVVPSMLTGVLHVLPLNVSAFPLTSTAAQNDDDWHDTDPRRVVPSMSAGLLHELPSNVNAFPVESTAAQKDADEHDTASGPPASAVVAADHVGAA
jgi:hypothetical protein